MSKKFKLGVVGDPIEHSLSPFIHSRFSRNENINLNYLAYRVNNDELDIFIKEFFYGGLSNAKHRILDFAEKSMNENLLSFQKEKIKILLSKLPDGQAGILGSSCLNL